MSDADQADDWTISNVRQLLRHLLPDQSTTSLSIIGIDGRSRSGKSSLAKYIEASDDDIAVIHTDDIAWHHSFFDWSDVLVAGVLKPLRRDGLPLSYVPEPWQMRGRPGAIDVSSDTRIVLLEGVGAARTELSGWLDASIWVQTAQDVAMQRTVAFDRDPPGFVEDWMRQENAHLDADQPWTRATAVVSGEYPFSDSSFHVRFPKSTSQSPRASKMRDADVFEVSGVLFDNDGVLVDSHDVAAKVWNQWASRWAPTFDFNRDVRHGLRIRDAVADIVIDPANVSEAARDLIDMEARLATRVGAIRGAPELVSECPSDSWAVVTSGRRSVALARLTSAGVPHPVSVVSAEDVDDGKPAADPYLLGAASLGLDPKRCAVFEDAAAGIASARAAGVAHVIGVGGATLNQDVDVAVRSLRGITFDGTRLTIPPEVMI
ncbi:MAG: mannitol-/sugar-/sorbitol-6-phosphatase [Mycobacterium sp.]|nr:mannitol-/sugar-/sorbitol-6-phosphatase [Mycobacterium sp.]